MTIYFTYQQTPELRTLESREQRDAVHKIAWKKLRRDQPQLWVRSFLIVLACAAVATFAAYPVVQALQWASYKDVIPFAAGAGAGIGAYHTLPSHGICPASHLHERHRKRRGHLNRVAARWPTAIAQVE